MELLFDGSIQDLELLENEEYDLSDKDKVLISSEENENYRNFRMSELGGLVTRQLESRPGVFLDENDLDELCRSIFKNGCESHI